MGQQLVGLRAESQHRGAAYAENLRRAKRRVKELPVPARGNYLLRPTFCPAVRCGWGKPPRAACRFTRPVLKAEPAGVPR
jgi:hypothetical protein